MSWYMQQRLNFRAFIDSLSIFEEETIWTEKSTQIDQFAIYSKGAVYYQGRNQSYFVVFEENKSNY